MASINKSTRARLIDSSNKRELEIDAVITQNITDSLRITRFPVETGFSISDHSFKENKKVTLSCVVSESTLRAETKDVIITGTTQITTQSAREDDRDFITVLGNQLLNKIPDNIFTRGQLKQTTVLASDIVSDTNKISSVVSARSFIQDVFKTSSLVTLKTSTEEISQLVITAVNFQKKGPQLGVLNFTLTLEQIRIVGVETGTTFISQNLNPAIAAEAAEESNIGFLEKLTKKQDAGDGFLVAILKTAVGVE
jgi:hypothetical protein